jgi:hypothetical protein
MNRFIARTFVFALAAAVSLSGVAHAQATRGSIAGTVKDASGAVIPGATVTVTNTDTNSTRTTVTNTLGFYRITALEPGPYTVRTELAGFQAIEAKGVRVNAALEVTYNAELKAGASEAITVVGETAGLELNKSNPTVGATVAARQVVELPLDANRNINNLIGLTPNTANMGTAGQGTFTANGNRSRNNNYMIDGSDNNDMSVTIATSQPVPESVAEYSVQTNPYTVEFGRNSGAQVNVTTKSGTNTFHGEAWDYYRNAKLYALTNVQKDAGLTEPPKFTRHQVGASIGGPIIKDKTFFFLLYQYDPQRPDASPGLTTRMLTPAGFAALSTVPLRPGQSAASRQAVVGELGFLQDVYAQNPVFRNLTNVTVNGVAIQTGQANVNITSPSTYHTFTGRIDHRLTDNDNLSLRYVYNKRLDDNAISNCNFGAIFCGSQDLKDTNLALAHTHVFSSNMVNEFRFSWVQRDLLFPENDPVSPTAAISGLFTVGGLSNFPQGRVTDAYQFSDSLTWTKGKHTFKFGADIRYNKAYNQSDFNSKGNFTFNSLQDYMNNTAFQLQQALQTASWDARQWQNFFYAQDDFRVNPDLTLNIGLRYEISTVPFGMFGATDPQSLGALVPGPVQKDTNNWAPRVGFAWSPSSDGFFGDGKTVVRGGFGMGYDVLFYNLLTVNGSNYPRVVTAAPTNVVDLYPNLLQTSGSAVFDPLAVYTNSPEDTQVPDSKYWSLSIGRELGDFTVEIGYAASRGYNGINQIHANPSVLTPTQAALVASTKNANAIPGVQARRVYPQFGARTLIPATVGPTGNDVEARSQYDGFYTQVQKRMSHGLLFTASYTYSKFMSNNDASLGESGTDGSSQRPQSMFDYEAEWSRSQFDRPHRLVFSYIYELPGFKSGVLHQILDGWQVSGVTAYQSGRPFTIGTGVDSNGDGTTGSDRPNINPSGTFTWDENHKGFTNTGYYTAPTGTNNLPIANGLGDGNAPRNSERGAGYWNTDLSILKRFYLGGARQFVIRGDLLNAFNQDNYGIPVATMTSASFGLNTNNWGNRSVTLSAKFIW